MPDLLNFPVLFAIHAIAAAAATGHALLQKREPQSAFAWIAVVVLYPIVGPVLYGLFGINRVRTRSRKLRDRDGGGTNLGLIECKEAASGASAADTGWTGFDDDTVRLARVGGAVANTPLRGGHTLGLLRDGDEAYPAMLAAIDAAQHRVWLATYIFETNTAGTAFIEALVRAHARGVDVRVLVDGIGSLYSRPTAVRRLSRAGVATARFLRPRLIPPQLFVNLRNHRKTLCVDGALAFAGGMNIGGRHMVAKPETGFPTRDVHFQIQGPVVEDLERLFLDDWGFARRSREAWTPAAAAADALGDGCCRVIPDGPDHHLDKLEALYTSVISAAEERVVIVTPYFLPPESMRSALVSAALRGVDVTVVLPEKSNLRYVQSAGYRVLPTLIRYGVRVVHQPEPFSHAKLLRVDERYVLCGSANVDARSFRLNFELGVEMFDTRLAAQVDSYIAEVLESATPVTLDALRQRPLWKRLFDGVFWLASPYL